MPPPPTQRARGDALYYEHELRVLRKRLARLRREAWRRRWAARWGRVWGWFR